jgi:hypothetical protein
VSQKKSFALRVDAEVYEALEKWAQAEFRSVNGQIEWALFQQLKASGRLKTTSPGEDTPGDTIGKEKDVR